MMLPSPFKRPYAAPFYSEHGLFSVTATRARQWEFNGWQTETLSWKTGCYIHSGLSETAHYDIRGPGAEAFLSSICVNNFTRFRPGTAKHAVFCDDRGLVTSHGVMMRTSEDHFSLFASGSWVFYKSRGSDFDVEVTPKPIYIFQVAGPTSLQVLEAAVGHPLRDVPFLGFREIRIGDKAGLLLRVGMAGSLAFEVHGPIADGPEVYDALYQAGRPFGVERLGWRSYLVNHTEGGFPQMIWHFLGASEDDPGFRAFARENPAFAVPPVFSGSVDPADLRARYRSPFEVGWGRSVRFDHDFVGREALEREAQDPPRTVATLEWDSDDVMDVYASLFRDGQDFKFIEFPHAPPVIGVSAHADHVSKNGKVVGVSSGLIYSYYYRRMLSLCTIDKAEAEVGNPVTVDWGDHGGRIKTVRARIARYPYLNEGRNQDVDLSKL